MNIHEYQWSFPADEQDISWLYNGTNLSIISLAQLDKSNVSVTALTPGTAAVTASLVGTAEVVTFHITVKREGVVDAEAPLI